MAAGENDRATSYIEAGWQHPRTIAGFCCAAIAGLTLLATQLLASGKTEMAVLIAVAPLVMCAVAVRPNVATYVVLLLVYTNAPVVFMRYHGVPFAAAASIPMALLIPIAYHALIRREPIYFPAVTVPIVLFVVVQAVATLGARDPATARETLVISLTEGVGLFVLVVNAIRTRESLRHCAWALLAAGAFMGLLCAHQYVTRSYHKEYGGFAQIEGKGFGVEREYGRVIQHRSAGPLGEKNRFAQIMLMLFPLGLYRFWGERLTSLRALAVIMTGLTAVGWGLAFSRGSAVGLVLALGVMVLLGCIRVKQVLLVSLIAGALLLLLPEYRTRLASLESLPSIISGTTDGGSVPDGAMKGRATEMLAAARLFMDYPILGVGPGMFRYYSREYGLEGGLRALDEPREAHCLYLAILAEQGALGFLCFGAVLFVTLRDLLRVRQRYQETDPCLGHLATGFMMAIVVYMTTGIFSHFSYVRYFWIMIALATAAVCVANRRLQVS